MSQFTVLHGPTILKHRVTVTIEKLSNDGATRIPTKFYATERNKLYDGRNRGYGGTFTNLKTGEVSKETRSFWWLERGIWFVSIRGQVSEVQAEIRLLNFVNHLLAPYVETLLADPDVSQ